MKATMITMLMMKMMRVMKMMKMMKMMTPPSSVMLILLSTSYSRKASMLTMMSIGVSCRMSMRGILLKVKGVSSKTPVTKKSVQGFKTLSFKEGRKVENQ